MPAFAIPFAPLWAQIICGIPLAVVMFLGLRWGGRNLWRSLEIIRGVAQPPSGSTRLVSGAVGLVFHCLVVVAALGAGYFLCALLTTKPTLLTESGVVVGAGPPTYQAGFIPWREVTSVECGMPRQRNVISRLVVRSNDERVELGSAGIELEPVRGFIAQHTRPGIVRPCKHEFK
jgi:hypothetical protein